MTARILPKYSKKQVVKAGDILRAVGDGVHTEDQEIWSYEVLQNFRAIHTYPINTFQATLRNRLAKIDPDALVAQRLKRTPSIFIKLLRFPEMKLSRMQDIGGIRAVVQNLRFVEELHHSYKVANKFQHTLAGEKDYIKSPKKTGYRGIHLVYKYKNPLVPEYDGLHIELQIRTRLQHAWATAVETMGTFLDKALKSSQGPEEWLAFFALIGSAFAHIEKCNPVPGFEGLSEIETYRKVQIEARRLSISEKLMAFSVVTEQISTRTGGGGSYHLIILDPDSKTVNIESYGRRKLDEANEAYARYEKQIDDGDLQVVLVATDSIDSLRQAYPNYFLDTQEFLKALNIISSKVRHADKKVDASALLSNLLRNV